MNARELSLDIIIEILEDGKFSNNMINRALNHNGYLEKRERSFITRLCEGTVERKITLDFIIENFSKTPLNKMRPQIRNILRMGVYQILYMDSVPASAACNESVKLTKKRGFAQLSGFVNGVLREVSRHEGMPESIMGDMPEERAMSILYSVPEWIVRYFLDHYGRIMTEEILKGYFTENRISIRCNVARILPERLKERLIKEGADVREGSWFPYAFSISGISSISDMQSFREGLFQVQDESSMFVGHLGTVKKDMVVLDLCAAPGGKSLHYADRISLAGGGKVISRDFSDKKLDLIKENFARCGFRGFEAEVKDATEFDCSMEGKADLVICDLPCSGLGILAKKPDIRYNMTPENQTRLADLQRNILANAVKYVKPGGELIYSTCTINKGENEGIAYYIEHKLGLSAVDLTDRLPAGVSFASAKDGYIQFLPGIHKTDGFFVSVFRKEQ